MKPTEQSVVKPTFAAAIQAKLSNLYDKTQQVDIQHGPHLGKPAVYLSAKDYLINIAQECKFTLIEKLYRGKPNGWDEGSLIRQLQLIGYVKIAINMST